MLKFDMDPGGKASAQIEAAARKMVDATPLFRPLAGMLESVTESNFRAQGRPAWVPLSKATRADRLRRNKGKSVLSILQDSGVLAKSISSSYGPDFAVVGAGGAATPYAAIHQFGGTIERAPYSVKTRLRTDARGNLVRQGANRNLAVFAKDSHKRARESWSTVDAYKVDIPARPYLPFSGPATDPQLQPEAEVSVLELLQRHVLSSFDR